MCAHVIHLLLRSAPCDRILDTYLCGWLCECLNAWVGDQSSRFIWDFRLLSLPPFPPTPLKEAEAQVSNDEQRAAGVLGNNKMPMSNGEDSLASEIIPPFDQQHDWSMQEDLMQPLAGSLDLLLGLDFSDLSRLTAVPPPLSPPAMNRLFSSGGDDPGNVSTCFWSDDDFGK